MSGGIQHFELTGVIGTEMTGWECAGCEAHLTTSERDSRTYGRVEHRAGCTELTTMLASPDQGETRSGMARIRDLERAVAELGSQHAELVQTSAEVAAQQAGRTDRLEDRVTDLETLTATVPGDIGRLLTAVSSLAVHGGPGHSLPPEVPVPLPQCPACRAHFRAECAAEWSVPEHTAFAADLIQGERVIVRCRGSGGPWLARIV